MDKGGVEVLEFVFPGYTNEEEKEKREFLATSSDYDCIQFNSSPYFSVALFKFLKEKLLADTANVDQDKFSNKLVLQFTEKICILRDIKKWKGFFESKLKDLQAECTTNSQTRDSETNNHLQELIGSSNIAQSLDVETVDFNPQESEVHKFQPESSLCDASLHEAEPRSISH